MDEYLDRITKATGMSGAWLIHAKNRFPERPECQYEYWIVGAYFKSGDVCFCGGTFEIALDKLSEHAKGEAAQ